MNLDDAEKKIEAAERKKTEEKRKELIEKQADLEAKFVENIERMSETMEKPTKVYVENQHEPVREVSVKNLKDVPRTVKVENLSDIPREVYIKNPPEMPEFPKSIRVENPQEEVTVRNMPKMPSVSGITKAVKEIASILSEVPKQIAREIKQETQPVNVRNDRLNVQLIDPKTGKPYKASGGGGTPIVGSSTAESDTYKEDDPHSSGDMGTQMLAVRNDDLESLVDTDGDYTPMQVGDDGALYTRPAGRVDSNNSSTSTLGSGGVFTGTAIDVKDATFIAVSVFTDQDSAADGLELQYSSDNSNFDHAVKRTVSANTSKVIQVTPEARYFRIKYTNGSSAQGTFRLQTVLHAVAGGPVIDNIGSGLNDTDNALITKSILTAKQPSGAYTNINATTGGNLKASMEEFDAAVDFTNTEDAAHGDGDIGAFVLGVRNDDDTALTDADGDYGPFATSEAGHMKTHLAHVDGIVSTNNSSTSTLGSSATFTGTGEEILHYAAIKVSVFTDQDSATDGLQLQFSSDNSNWDISYDFTVTANQAFVAEVGPEARYFRVVYTNGNQAQGAFRLQTIFHPVSTEKLGAPIESTVEAEDDAQLVRAVLTAKDAQGDYNNVNATSGGNMKFALEELGTIAGQATKANSLPVTLASDEDTVNTKSEGTALGNGQVSVDATAGGTTVLSASAGRQGVTITNQGSVTCYIGTGTVSTSNGFELKAGESVAIPTDSEVKGIVSSGSTTIGFLSFA